MKDEDTLQKPVKIALATETGSPRDAHLICRQFVPLDVYTNSAVGLNGSVGGTRRRLPADE